ncbi:amino acid ABC transporter permease [Gluconacetobacter diazotrophicus]|uniref:Putative inner membrane amino-acid ABC transporter permease n=1 Tax=Gluconacetobacter diazotrophicus (strain ATCC 49037 / DSM 5601 / CCUG 37298 / CIP 103539 / LMG 7603 / PAl5) TaxID=272568 RepID=A9HPZ7_GLUDA|nr:amino acid ABC transporter permease [Gluconacetobacter diazotrophicus]CAP56653.1 putative inner membrane amino-acid ABC transporter permease [Gluconacetobacter diazotrophicus PA1 5]
MTALHFQPVLQRLPFLLGGAATTVLLSVASFGAGLLLAGGLAVLRAEGPKAGQRFSTIYSTIMTNTPQLSQIFAIFYCLALLGVMVSPFASVFIGMALNAAGYLADIVTTGLGRVPPLYHDAAASLGLTRRQAYMRVIFPHALQTMAPALANHFQIMILGSSMASIFGVEDLTGRAYDVGSTTFRILEVMLVAGVLYALLSVALTGLFALGRRLFEAAA